MKSLKNKTQKEDWQTGDTRSAKNLSGREAASMSGTRQSMGHSNEGWYRREPGAHWERLKVEKQNDCRHYAVQKRKNGNWGFGWVFLQVVVQFACVVLHIVLLYLVHWIWGSLAGNAEIAHKLLLVFGYQVRDFPNNSVAAENQENIECIFFYL